MEAERGLRRDEDARVEASLADESRPTCREGVAGVECAQLGPTAEGQAFGVERTPVGEFEADLLDAWKRDGVHRLDPGLKAHGDRARVVAGKRPRRNAAPQVDDQALGLRALGVDRHREDADGDRKHTQDEGSRPALSTRQTPGRTKGSLGGSAWQLEHPCDLGLPTRKGGNGSC